ncbi:Acetate transporter [Komagataella phaffii CBS 7435]|uniref:Transmembrane protein involved in export of ammonia n=2 Tax=Komagataella phaffii TaxID=460519 RepID=C4QX22_KOMPG|nr:Putative transmembrane protein involved in export of ammonia [Komagataella phaffii GS115]AOA61549.1 GQ67_02230T0 [Komagataella phaffii]KAI0464827.1 hypothetical protein LJB42_000038 [Komagataella kurtzmanii]CAH2446594.1 Acetate transporter [Komagataella phaffii CBS 7435]AOA65615.1 GQ68_02244T0 [Komagataella phaffii GS115]CAY67795.1 Putative transmembrane protein involved in export of ammonia [Komagataella phaffii GS115]
MTDRATQNSINTNQNSNSSFNQDVEKGDVEAQGAPAQPTFTNSTFRHDDQNIYINDTAIPKEEFMYAFGGTLTTGRQSVHRSFGNPVPAGLAGFSLGTFALGLILLQARGVTDVSILIGMFLFVSGVVEIIAGIWCIVVENTWASVVFLGYGSFWLGYAAIVTPAFGVAAAYETAEDFNNAVGMYLCPWAVFSFILWSCTWKSTWPLTALVFCIFMIFLVLTIGYFVSSVPTIKAGGVFCFVGSLLGFYNMYAGLANPTNSYVVVHPLFMPNAAKPAS